MTIVYAVGQSLYLNITNRCSNRCWFCVRNKKDGLVDGSNLWLKQEPTVEQVLRSVSAATVKCYSEFVFCGYGEPMMRAYDVIELSRELKRRYLLPVRINTNGQGNLICGRDITPLMAEVIDAVSISLNAKNAGEYQRQCASEYGEAAFSALLDFAKRCTRYVPSVTFSVVDIMEQSDIAACREIARQTGVGFKIRHYVGS